ncbi:MAG: flagellar export chaperone FliS [Clostridiaceae bacterium]|jgi:flagellar protein FliS|nr:flagellar export chaperone FliS [Clostridiaceae bacterium]
MNITGYNQYKENSVNTAQPEELILMLYNGLVKFIMKAQHAISKNDMQEAHVNIIKSENIVREFIASLDGDYEVSSSLLLVYDYMERRLIEANIQKSMDILDEVLGFAKELRATWEQAMKLAKQPPKKSAVGI